MQLSLIVLIVEPKNSHPKFVDNKQILIVNLTIWIGCILIGGLIFFGMQTCYGVKLKHWSTPFLEMTSAFFGGGTIRITLNFVRVFMLSVLFGAFFFNSIFAGSLFNLFTNIESESRINTFEKLSKTNYTYYYDVMLRYHVTAINDTMRNKTGLIMGKESAMPKVMGDLVLTNQIPFAFVLIHIQVGALVQRFSSLADFTIIPQPLCEFLIS